MRRPALMLPMGKKDWVTGERLAFLTSCQSVLGGLGWCIGIDLKGNGLGPWAKEYCQVIRDLGGRLSWHPSEFATFGLGSSEKPISDELRKIVETAGQYKEEFGLEVLNLHCAPYITSDPPTNLGWKRYYSPVGAAEFLCHIQNQVEPLRELNRRSDGILHIENVDLCFFRQQSEKPLPTYLALQTGAWKDLIWLAKKAGLKTVFDSEHFFGTRNLFKRENGFDWLPIKFLGRMTDEENSLSEVTGYYIAKGSPPQLTSAKASYEDFISAAKPNLFHLGGAVRAFRASKIAAHLPLALRSRVQKEVLDFELCWIVDHHCAGAVVEVCGQKCDIHPEYWSGRIRNDEVAKMSSYLVVLDRLEELKDGGVLA